MKKLVLILVLCLIAANSADARFLLFSDNFNLDNDDTSAYALTINDRWDYVNTGTSIGASNFGQPSGLSGPRQAGPFSGPATWLEMENLAYVIQIASSDMVLPTTINYDALQIFAGFGAEQHAAPLAYSWSADLEVNVDYRMTPNTGDVGMEAFVFVGDIGVTQATGTGIGLVDDGTWNLYDDGAVVATGAYTEVNGAWININVELVGNIINVALDGSPIVTDYALAGTESEWAAQVGINDSPNNSTSGTWAGSAPLFDNIVVMGVPEPATMALLGLGGLALLRKKRS